MLGQFLEFSVPAHPIAAALAFYRGLGFQDPPVGDILATPYAVVLLPGIAIGLHEREFDGPVATFVRPELGAHARALRHVGVRLEFANLAEDEFNQLGFLDPNARPVTLLEARTWSPAAWETATVPLCGAFLEFSVPTHSAAESEEFWQRLGCAVVARQHEAWASVRLHGYGVTIGFHEHQRFVPGFTFVAPNLDARIEFLQAKGYAPARGAPVAAPGRPAATLIAPEGTPIYLLEP
jgi:hypothetical protein